MNSIQITNISSSVLTLRLDLALSDLLQLVSIPNGDVSSLHNITWTILGSTIEVSRSQRQDSDTSHYESTSILFIEVVLIFLFFSIWIASMVLFCKEYGKIRITQPRDSFNRQLPQNIKQIHVVKEERNSVIYTKPSRPPKAKHSASEASGKAAADHAIRQEEAKKQQQKQEQEQQQQRQEQSAMTKE